MCRLALSVGELVALRTVQAIVFGAHVKKGINDGMAAVEELGRA